MDEQLPRLLKDALTCNDPLVRIIIRHIDDSGVYLLRSENIRISKCLNSNDLQIIVLT